MDVLLVGQSGGPTAVINASLVGVLNEAKKHNIKVLGCVNGIKGILDENFVEYDESIINTPAAYLGSVRYKLTDEYDQILNIFKKHNVKYFMYIGGNDSCDTSNKIANYFKKVGYDCKVIGIPKTIDNDLVKIDHCPGYGSSAKFIATSIEEIYLDTQVYEKGRVTIVEVMGRDAGWLTASAKIASLNNMGPDLIYLPEVSFDSSKFVSDVKKIYEQKQKVLVVVSEGIKDETGSYFLLSRNFNNNDDFGHLQLGGIALMLSELISNKLGLPVRGIELNLPQRCAGHIMSLKDRNDAYKVGVNAVKLAIKGYTGYLANYKLNELISLEEVATKVKQFPLSWIIDGNQISDEYLNYVLPLVKGEVKQKFENGIPKYMKR